MGLSVGAHPYSGGRHVGRWPVAGSHAGHQGALGDAQTPAPSQRGTGRRRACRRIWRLPLCRLRLNSGFCVFKWLKKEDYLARRGSARKPKCQPASFQPRPSAHVLSVAAPVCSGHKPKVCAVWPSPENGWCRGRLGPRDREPVVMPAERERGRRPGVRRARTASSARRGRPALPSLDTGSTWGARGE